MRMRTLIAAVTLALSSACAPAPTASGSAADDAAIKAMAASYSDAWAKGDAKALSAMMSDDVHTIEITGQHLEGRAIWEQAAADNFAARPAGQSLAITTSFLRWLDANTAVSGGGWAVTGAPAGAPAKGAWSNTVVRSGTGWSITSSHVSVDFVPPAPMAADTSKAPGK